jgi:8-oxo-dGTP diphosphatase
MFPEQVFSSYDRSGDDTGRRYRYCPVCAAPLVVAEPPAEPRQVCPACDWVCYRNPAPGVVIMITVGDRVLLGRRALSSFGAGTWCLPGGFIEYGEDFLGAAIRETLEETGLTVEICSILSVVSNFFTADLHTLVVVLKARILSGAPRPGDDLAELGWFPLAGPFPELAFEADRHIIERYRQTRLEGTPVDPRHALPSVETPT